MPPQQHKGKKGPVKGSKGAPNKGKGKARVPYKTNIADVFEADDDKQRLSRKGHDLDEVDDYEYNVGEIQDEDDEEIDSDEAFDESDDEKFESFKFHGSTKADEKKKMKKPKSYNIDANSEDENVSEEEIDLNESENEDEGDSNSEDGEDYVDLSDMLNDPASSELKKTVKNLMPVTDSSDDEMDNFDFEDDSEEDEDEDEKEDEAAEEESDDENDEKIVSFIDSLENKKRKKGENDGTNKKKKHIPERTEVYQENEFNLLARSSESNDGKKKKIDMNDLMGSFSNEVGFESMRKSLLALDGKGKHAVKRALDAPLPKRLQDRMERQAAYNEANKEIARWQPTVKKNREADHLTFPMQGAAVEKMSSANLASKFKPETDMEKEIEKALEEAGMKDEELEEFEALKLNKLSVEEVEKRRNDLRLMRELMFRHEIKAKRLGKIKSKSYRKLQRKEKAKLELQIKQMEEVDHGITHEDQVKAAMDRAEERMSLKHKNTGQWAKRALARGNQDEGTREAIMDQLRRGEQLKRKVQGRDSDDGSEDESEEEDLDVTDKEEIMRQLAKLEDEPTKAAKGLMSMKFMQEGEKRQKEATDAQIDSFKDEWLSDDSDEEGGSTEKTEKEVPTHSIVENNPGRMAFGAKKANKANASKSENKSEHNIEKIKKLQKDTKAAEDVDDVKLDLTKTLTMTATPTQANKKQKISATVTVSSTPAAAASDSEDDDEAEERVEFTQRELVARAFANDDVVAEFEEEKKKVVEEDDDKVEDLTLPGWGSWGGKGVRAPKKKKKFTRTIKGVAPSERKDVKLSNVIINEKKNKKAEKYQVTHVPFPFQNMEQYERSLRAPVGKEWNTRETFQKMTKPRVITKLGAVIDPLSAPFK
ncbi:small-subunit processome [Phycomyces blakesleeanus]|uniref:Small-subunit processome n=1 Tax=Phycomyces blakesleeanus TaxID=4837 RepID=A0ABR3AVU2_PHYBL